MSDDFEKYDNDSWLSKASFILIDSLLSLTSIYQIGKIRFVSGGVF